MVVVLLALRFALELALVATIGVLAVRLSPVAWVGWLIGLALVGAVVTLWGAVISPRRRLDVPLPVRAGIELALFAAAALGLVLAGHPVWAATLLGAEVLVLTALWILGLPPGTDVTRRRSR